MNARFIGLALFAFGVSASASPAEVLIIRHAEKPLVAALGKSDGRDLSPRGYQRADALVSLFTKDARMLEFGMPVAVYAGSPKKTDTGSIRSLETIQPTATALGLTPKTSFISDEFGAMVSEVMKAKQYDGKTVLIAWPHNQIPDMASSFGVASKDVPEWTGEIFDRVWQIKFDDKGGVQTFQNLPQRLLSGDSAN